MNARMLCVVALLPLATGGCLAKTALDVATFPVKAAGKAVDWTTTSQSESDRNYGRKMRKQEAREGAERKQAYKDCRKRSGEDCDRYDGYRAGTAD